MIKDILAKFKNNFVNHGEFIYKKGSFPATVGDIESFFKTEFEKEINNLIADIVNATKPNNDQMKTVRILRGRINNL